MSHSSTAPVFDRIAALEDEIVDSLARLVAIPSISGNAEQAAAAGAQVAKLCSAAGCRTEVWQSDGAPAIFARMPGPAGAPTILFYGHYDVQPPDPLEEWISPPFVPTVRDGALFGRGAGDNKGQFIGHLFALRALAETGGCPVGVKLLLEGEEEMGSPHLADIVTAHREELACDVAITADGPYHADGSPLVILGVRGLAYLDVAVEGEARDLHSGAWGGVAAAPARTLARALAHLWDDDGRVAVPGFYDDVQPPSAAERELADALPPPAEGATGAWRRLMFEPNVNIAGIRSGYSGDGMKTVIPHRAAAKIDVRLVAHQEPRRVFDRIAAFLAGHGLSVRLRAAVPPSRTPLENPYTEPVRRALQRVWQRPPRIQPCLGGTTPDFVFTQLLGVPSLLVPYAPSDMHHHAPNERMELQALHRGVRTSAALCLEIGGIDAA